jgi:hypothetical protein
MNMVEAHWVDVTWMPHSSLSQTSYVALAIRELSIPEECRVQVEVQGLGGLHWTVPCQTTAADGVWNQVLQLPSDGEIYLVMQLCRLISFLRVT